MRHRAFAAALMAALAIGPALANICALNCDLDAAPPASVSCHEESPVQPAPDQHPAPSSCAHDHITPRTAIKATALALGDFGPSHDAATISLSQPFLMPSELGLLTRNESPPPRSSRRLPLRI